MFAFAKTYDTASAPTRGSSGSAGYDMSAFEDASIEPNTWKAVDTGIVIQIPSDCYARVAPRSGLALKKGIDVLAGVIDSDYRDSIKVILMNHGPEPFRVSKGDRIAQLVFERIYTPNLVEMDRESLTNTARNTGGFGSTGV